MDFSLLHKIIFVITEISVIFCSIWIYLANRKNKVNQLFFLMGLAIFMFLFFYYNLSISSSGPLTILLPKFGYFFASWFFIFLYLFFINLLNIKIRLLDKIVVGWWIFGAIISVFTNLIVKGVIFENGIYKDLILGKGAMVYYLWVSFTFSLVLFFLFKKYRTTSTLERLKYQYFLIGVFIWVILNIIFNVGVALYLQSIKYAALGSYSVIFFVAFTAYAIVKQNLFGIKVVLTSFFVAIIAILLFLDTLVLTEDPVLKILKGIIFIFFLFFGHYLIRATNEEEKRREEAERMAAQERTLREEAERIAIRESTLRKKLERLNQARQQFLLSSQHYFRTPLTAIMGFLELALDSKTKKPPSAEVERWLLGARKGAEELKKRIEESLEISQIESGKGMLELKEVHLEELVKEIIKEAKIEAAFKKLPLIFEKPKAPLSKIKVDEARIREALSNIVTNAIKHTPAGKIMIKLEEVKGGEAILFSVKDTGIGIPKEELSFIGATPFERGKSAQKLTPMGKGIGLYLSRLIIETHGGKLWAESEGVDKGSTFFVELPIK